MIICIDFDGTVVEHHYPRVGRDVPGAVEWLRRIVQSGGQLILWTMRSPGRGLEEAVQWYQNHDIPLWGVNQNPKQSSWTQSPKAYAQLYVDDAAYGCPLIHVPGGPSYVDWERVGPGVLQLMELSKR